MCEHRKETCGDCRERPGVTYDGVFTCTICDIVVTDEQEACEEFLYPK